MELINPDGTKREIKMDDDKQKQADAAGSVDQPEAVGVKEKTPEKPPFACNIGSDGVMRLEIALPVCVGSDDMLCLMRGFMDAKRDEAIASVLNARAEIAKQRATILQAKNKGLFNGFLKKLGR